MKKNILFLSLLCATLCLSGCNDDDNTPYSSGIEEPTETGNPAITRLAWKDTEKAVAFLNEAQDIPVNLQIVRTGSSNIETVIANFSALTQTELETYNTENSTNYKLLSDEYYTLPVATEVAADVQSLSLKGMTIKESVKEVTDLSSSQYVIPLRISSESCEISEDYDILIIQLKVTTPKFSLLEKGIIGEPKGIISGSSATFTQALTIKLDVDNRWDNTLSFVTDEAKLQALTDTYNQTSGEETVAKLLPAGYYTLSSINFSATTNNPVATTVTVTSTPAGDSATPLEEGEYVLPVSLASCEGMPFLVGKEIAYLRFSVVVPTFSLKDAGTVTKVMGTTSTYQSITKQVTVAMNLANQWNNNTLTFVTEQTELEALVQTYNSANSLSHTLLPSSTYVLNNLTFNETGAKEKNMAVNITLSNDVTANTTYLLPIALKSCSNSLFQISKDENMCYLLIEVIDENEIQAITLNENNVSAISTDNAITNMTDANIDTQWQSKWYTSKNDTKKYLDPKYGVYIDITKVSIEKAFTLEMKCKDNWDNAPKATKIYAGTSEDDLKEIASYDNLFTSTTGSGNNTTGETKTNLFKVDNTISMIRISLITNSSDKKLTDNSSLTSDASWTYIPSVCMSSIKLWGK